MPNRSYEFVQLDVFTQTPLTGNALAVFNDGRGLSDEEMQALAREMNLSETTFIFPRDAATEAREGKKVRIFTVAEELPFAGHPTLGTALYLYSTQSATDSGKPEQISLDLKVGKIDIVFREDARKAVGEVADLQHASRVRSPDEGSQRVDGRVFGEMRQRDPEFGAELPRDKIGSALRGGSDVIASQWPCQVVSTGLPFAIVPIRDVNTLSILQVDIGRVGDLLKGTGAKFCYFIAREDRQGKVRARMFFYGGEDPATGSAAGCAISWMARHGWAKSDERIIIHQGSEAHRPSEIFVCASVANKTVTDVRVGGYAVEVLRGTVTMK
jgi:trans-2,3-dihydro-3-hydroxyanthranilate isomerase